MYKYKYSNLQDIYDFVKYDDYFEASKIIDDNQDLYLTLESIKYIVSYKTLEWSIIKKYRKNNKIDSNDYPLILKEIKEESKKQLNSKPQDGTWFKEEIIKKLSLRELSILENTYLDNFVFDEQIHMKYMISKNKTNRIVESFSGFLKLNKYNYLKEADIAVVSNDIKLIITLDKTVHAEQRQLRHDTAHISESDIISTVENSLRKIGLGLLFDKFDIGDNIHIQNRRTNLNVVGVLLDNKNNTLKFKIITVMIKPNFKPYENTYTITI